MSKTTQPKTKEPPRFDLFSVEVLTLDRKGDKNALLRQFETEFAASQQRIETLKAETDAIAKKTDRLLTALVCRVGKAK